MTVSSRAKRTYVMRGRSRSLIAALLTMTQNLLQCDRKPTSTFANRRYTYLNENEIFFHHQRRPACPVASWRACSRVIEQTQQMLVDALRSGRGTVNGAYTGREPYERRFAAAYAPYDGVPNCVPTSHGSSALRVAVGAVQTAKRVACASAVAGIGASMPVPVDVDEDTLCMSLDAAKAAMTHRTAAIMLVHLVSSAADLDGFKALNERHTFPLVEDCSQAHSARWRGDRVDSFSMAGAFSFQQTKLLTCGEGAQLSPRTRP